MGLPYQDTTPWNGMAGVPMAQPNDPNAINYGRGFGALTGYLSAVARGLTSRGGVASGAVSGENAPPTGAEIAARSAGYKGSVTPVDASNPNQAGSLANNEGRYPAIGVQTYPAVIPGSNDPPDQRSANVLAADAASRANWNGMVDRMTGMGVKNAAGVMAPAYPGAPGAGQPGGIPAWDKASGMAAIAAGGAPRLLNYDNSRVVGSRDPTTPGGGAGWNGLQVDPSSKKFNSFSGFGTQAPVDAHQQALDHVNDYLNQAAEATRNGLPGKAAQLQAQAHRTAATMGALATASYQAGHIDVMNRQAAQVEKEQQPGIAGKTAQINALIANQPEMAGKIGRVLGGGSAAPPIQVIGGMQYAVTEDGVFHPLGIPGAPGADPNRGMPKP